MSSVSVLVFAALLPADVETATLAQRGRALAAIIQGFCGMCVLSALLVWLFVPPTPRRPPLSALFRPAATRRHTQADAGVLPNYLVELIYGDYLAMSNSCLMVRLNSERQSVAKEIKS